MPSTSGVPETLDTEDSQPGGLLGELERRQDDVIAQLEDLDAKLSEVLKGLEPEPKEDDSEETEDFFAPEF